MIVNSPHVNPSPPTALEVYDGNMKRTIKVDIIEPVTITTRESSWARCTSFTSYNIIIESDHWCFSQSYSSTIRRYSEFVWLREKLCARHPNKTIPTLPKKRIFSSRNPAVIEERRYGLGKFLQRVMRSNELLSDAALHLFLQSDLPTDEIEQKLVETSLKPGGARKTPGSRLNPYLLRSLSTGSSAASSEADFTEGDINEGSETEAVEASEDDLSDNSQRKLSFSPDTPIIMEPQKVSLVITHEDSDEVVDIPNSPLEPPILSSLTFTNSATESFRKFSYHVPLCPVPIMPIQQVPVK